MLCTMRTYTSPPPLPLSPILPRVRPFPILYCCHTLLPSALTTTALHLQGTSADLVGLQKYFEGLMVMLKACPGVYCSQGQMVKLLTMMHEQWAIFTARDEEHLDSIIQDAADMWRICWVCFYVVRYLFVDCCVYVLRYLFCWWGTRGEHTCLPSLRN